MSFVTTVSDKCLTSKYSYLKNTHWCPSLPRLTLLQPRTEGYDFRWWESQFCISRTSAVTGIWNWWNNSERINNVGFIQKWCVLCQTKNNIHNPNYFLSERLPSLNRKQFTCVGHQYSSLTFLAFCLFTLGVLGIGFRDTTWWFESWELASGLRCLWAPCGQSGFTEPTLGGFAFNGGPGYGWSCCRWWGWRLGGGCCKSRATQGSFRDVKTAWWTIQLLEGHRPCRVHACNRHMRKRYMESLIKCPRSNKKNKIYVKSVAQHVHLIWFLSETIQTGTVRAIYHWLPDTSMVHSKYMSSKSGVWWNWNQFKSCM